MRKVDIAAAIKPVYGDEPGNHLTQLLGTQHHPAGGPPDGGQGQ